MEDMQNRKNTGHSQNIGNPGGNVGNLKQTENPSGNIEQGGVVRRRLGETLPILYLETLLLTLAGQILGGILIGILSMCLPGLMTEMYDIWYTASVYGSFIGIWILLFLFVGVSARRRPILKAMGPKATGNNGKNFLLGLLIGFGLNGLCILAAYLHQDIAVQFDSVKLVSLLVMFVLVFIQSAAEEMLCRGFLYQMLLKGSGRPVFAIVGNSLFFAVLHLFNDGVTVLSVCNIFLVGILFSFMVYYMDSLWCAFAAHAAWNFTQNIVFGLPNSGIVVPYSVFKLDAASAADSFAYNVGFGIEGTILADGVLLIACVAMYLWGRKYGNRSYVNHE